MSNKEHLSRHKIIIQTVRKKPSSYNEVMNKVYAEFETLGYEKVLFSKRTFQRDLNEIRTIYNVDIQFDRKQRVYKIVEDELDEYSDRMFEALDIFQALNLNQSFSSCIQFDTRKPAGTEHLSGILYAVQNKFQLEIRYQKFWSDELEVRVIEPYLLKEFRKRWYVFAYDLKRKEFRTFGLDRIIAMNIKPVKFQHPQKVNAKDHFKDSFGIISPDEDMKVQKILLRFTGNQGNYIKTMPLHESQEILKETKDEMLVKVTLAPTWDFMMEILYYGEFVKVLEPKSFAEQIENRLKKAAGLYEK